MNSFDYSCPTKVVFGLDKIKTIADYLPNSHKNVLIVSSKTAAVKSGALGKIRNSNKKAQIEFEDFTTLDNQ